MSPDSVTDAQLFAFLDESLSIEQSNVIEQELRSNKDLLNRLSRIIENENRGVHSLAAIWRRGRISCPTREELGSYLLGALEEAEHDYITFHLEVIRCSYCTSSAIDLSNASQSPTVDDQTAARRSRYFESSIGRNRDR